MVDMRHMATYMAFFMSAFIMFRAPSSQLMNLGI